ncbi:MAG: thiamine pyrophosphate-dependent enzyme, partial [Rubrobacter sp.]
ALGTPKSLLEAIEGADLIVSIGSRMDEVTSQSYAFPKAGQDFIALHPESGLRCDVGETLRALLDAAPQKTHERDWREAHAAYLASSAVPASRSRFGTDPARVIGALGRVLPEDAIVANDAGNSAGFLHRYYRYTWPGTQLAPANGAMGYGLPAAVAAKLARPEKTVISVSGDGGFLMTGQEIETAVRHGLSLTVVVMRNGLHGRR